MHNPISNTPRWKKIIPLPVLIYMDKNDTPKNPTKNGQRYTILAHDV
jgi:hypothetical protein